VWVFANLFLDATAIAAQSLVGFFYGAGRFLEARRLAALVCMWSAGAGCVMALIMLLGHRFAAIAFVPASALALFTPAWVVAALAQPISALSFITDGIHWGTGDYRYLRNVVALATMCGILGLILLDENRPGALTWIWVITAIWIVIRALFGMIRIWPGIGNSPLTVSKACEKPVAGG
jgi:MATE family multidrug resistance protein